MEVGRNETQKRFGDMRCEIAKQTSNMHDEVKCTKREIIGTAGTANQGHSEVPVLPPCYER